MKLNKKLLISALFSFSLLSFTPSVMADVESDFDQAVQYYKQENYHQAFPIFKELAEQGHSAAQFNLALMYTDGKGVRQDYAQAVKWYKAAADLGDASAQVINGLKNLAITGFKRLATY